MWPHLTQDEYKNPRPNREDSKGFFVVRIPSLVSVLAMTIKSILCLWLCSTAATSSIAEHYQNANKAAVNFWIKCGNEESSLNSQTREFLASSRLRYVSPDEDKPFKKACHIISTMNHLYTKNHSKRIPAIDQLEQQAALIYVE